MLCVKSIFPRKHIAVAKVERLGNPNKVGKVKSNDLVLIQRIVEKIVKLAFGKQYTLQFLFVDILPRKVGQYNFGNTHLQEVERLPR